MLPFTLEFVLALIGAFLLSLILTPLVRFISFRVGAVDEPNARRINKVTMPSAGGLAIFLAFLIIALFVLPRLTVSVKSEIPYFDYIFPVLAGATVVTLTGYFDDIFEISPKTKTLGIVVGALIIWAFTDFRFDSFKIPFGGPMLSFGPIVTFILTLLW
ncbi:undecaprenyl/decaprenyl-phosphate alpha-N-acetylglucosaminyl 1-phosphate transferase, partial [Streptococcus pluranimalium]